MRANLAIATLWADVLHGAGLPVSVQRAFNSGIAGEIPPDQALPELWACPGCEEIIDGPFDQCWRCGAAMPHRP